MKKQLFFEIIFLLSVFHVSLAQNPIDSVIQKEEKKQQQAPMLILKADHNPVQIGEMVRIYAKLDQDIPGANFQFSRGDGNVISSAMNQNNYIDQYFSTGSHSINVLVKLPGMGLSDTLKIQVDSVALFVDCKIVETGKSVKFETKFNSIEPDIVYRFNFGKNIAPSDWNVNDEIEFPYLLPGEYQVYAEIGRMFEVKTEFEKKSIPKHIEGKVEFITKSISKNIKVIIPEPEIVTLILEAHPHTLVGDTVTFIASTNVEGKLEYEFYFGDNFEPKRTKENKTQFPYPYAGRFTVFVKLFKKGNEITRSKENIVRIELPLKPDLWPYILGGIALIAAGYLIRKWYYKSKVLTFHPHPDKDYSNVKKPDNLDIYYEVHFDPNLANANHQLKPKEENLIKSKTVKQ